MWAGYHFKKISGLFGGGGGGGAAHQHVGRRPRREGAGAAAPPPPDAPPAPRIVLPCSPASPQGAAGGRRRLPPGARRDAFDVLTGKKDPAKYRPIAITSLRSEIMNKHKIVMLTTRLSRVNKPQKMFKTKPTTRLSRFSKSFVG
ncbi:unnamed protein product [Leptidea sinapis]|uniref:Uncharacterized protein n=1 Tax=Leptidea sinapis TaxID=189913 RepID=A0A5E4PSJ9_9NEOP|nr:unnamed protein product [Leptidea sinapis]